MLDLSYIYVALTIFAVLILFFIALKISKLSKNLNQSLELLPPLLLNLKSASEKLQENLEVSKETFEKLNHLLEELKIVPRVVEEIGASVKDLEAFLKGQIETIKDDLHFTIEDLRDILKETKSISSELKGKTLQLTQGVDPLIKSLTESATTVKLLLDTVNTSLKKTVIEVNALTAGISEILKGLKRVFKL
ncbi:MAG: hypothetical protein ACP5QC_05930 [Caldimicrobium sp.]